MICFAFDDGTKITYDKASKTVRISISPKETGSSWEWDVDGVGFEMDYDSEGKVVAIEIELSQ